LGFFATAFLRCGPAQAQGVAPGEKIPQRSSPASPGADLSFEHLEAAGALIGEIRIDTQDVFDLSDERENNALYRGANAFHITTRPEVIRGKLLFKSGERVSKRLIEESERLLLANRFLYDVRIRATAYHDGVADIEVRTRDTWTLQPGISASRSGGTNRTGLTVSDYNIFGTGASAGVKRISDAERTSTEYRVTDPHAFDGWTTLDFSLAQLSDGSTRTASVTRPFYALDTRRAAGLSASRDTRLISLFSGGALASQYRRWEDRAEAFSGVSAGLVDGWTQRYSLGLSYLKDAYAPEPGLRPPAELPTDQELVAPFLRYEVVEDDFARVKNRDLIERAEFFAMGFQSSLQLGRSLPALGSTQSLWRYTVSASDGIRLPRDQTLLLSGTLDGQSGYSPLDKQSWLGSIRYYGSPKGNTLLFSSLSGGVLEDPTNSTQLVLGGDTGLRGYPRNYQSGDRYALFSIEQRVYTDWYPFRLFRVGGAVFYDLGRAWGGPNEITANNSGPRPIPSSESTAIKGWLNDVGFGLRLVSARSAFGNVLHIDLAFPLDREPGIKSVQFLVTTKVTL